MNKIIDWEQEFDKKFFLDYENGLMFRDNGDGTCSLARLGDVKDFIRPVINEITNELIRQADIHERQTIAMYQRDAEELKRNWREHVLFLEAEIKRLREALEIIGRGTVTDGWIQVAPQFIREALCPPEMRDGHVEGFDTR